MQREPTFAEDQVSGVIFDTLCKPTSYLGIQVQSSDLPTRDSCQRNIRPMKSGGTLIVSDETDVALRTSNWSEGWGSFTTSKRFCNLLWKFLFPLDLLSETRLDCFGCLHSGRDHQLRRQLWVAFSHQIVGSFMQLDTILFPAFPPISHYCIQTFRVLLNSFKQQLILLIGGQQWKTDGSLHDNNSSKNILRKETVSSPA